MPQIVTRTHFTKNNGLYVPLAVVIPVATTSTASPNNAAALDALCESVEKSLLLNSLGTVLYNQLQTALADIENVANVKWKKLVQGEDYDGKFWYGLNHDLTFIAQKVFEEYLTQNNDFVTATGVKQTKSEKSKPNTPAYKIAAASQNFIKNYQGGYLLCPEVYDADGTEFVDFYGQRDEIEVSFYRYMQDRQADFPTWDASKFRIYSQLDDIKNSFGL